jgi:transposase
MTTEAQTMNVMIGVDPHKRSHTAVAIDDCEQELARIEVRATKHQVEQLQRWANPFDARVWAIESATGLGYLLAQQLVAAGETVLDVPPTLAARVRVLGTGRSNKNDPNDGCSVAVAALRAPQLASVQPADHVAVLRLLAKRNLDLGRERNRVACRLHAMICELVPGGIAQEISASRAETVLGSLTPTSTIEAAKITMALELVGDIRRLDGQLAEMKRRIRDAVVASKTSLTDLFGVGPIVACVVIGYSGDVTRFANRDRYAAYNGTAPVEMSSAGRIVHRLSLRGNRTLNYAIHMAAIAQIRHPHSDGRVFFDRKVAESKTKREALRSLKRHISNALYRQLLLDADRRPA